MPIYAFFDLTMISLTTAKLLLIVALSAGPKDITHSIMISSNPDDCVWTQESHGWNLNEKGPGSGHWPGTGVDYSTQDLNDLTPEIRHDARVLAHHDWDSDSVLYLDSGDRVEKSGDKVFYTFNPGSPNQKVYTILYVENGIPL